jgi:hypothetical protein
MNKEIAKAHAATLGEWADNYDRDGGEGATEVSFLLRRAARMIGKTSGFDTGLPVEREASDPAVTEPLAG